MKLSWSNLLIMGMFMTSSSVAQDQKKSPKLSQATFAAGCFWHEEALFESIKGVKEVTSGYAGGKAANPTYESIETGNTDTQKL